MNLAETLKMDVNQLLSRANFDSHSESQTMEDKLSSIHLSLKIGNTKRRKELQLEREMKRLRSLQKSITSKESEQLQPTEKQGQCFSQTILKSKGN